jgi:hypothetical protein
VLGTAKKQAEVNAMFIEINRFAVPLFSARTRPQTNAARSEIMANNESIVNFNAEKIAEHVAILSQPDAMAKYCAAATPEGNAALIAANKGRIEGIVPHSTPLSSKRIPSSLPLLTATICPSFNPCYCNIFSIIQPMFPPSALSARAAANSDKAGTRPGHAARSSAYLSARRTALAAVRTQVCALHS